jgi:hypothetical protein
MAYGADPQTFGDLVDKGYLPQARPRGAEPSTARLGVQRLLVSSAGLPLTSAVEFVVPGRRPPVTTNANTAATIATPRIRNT